MQSLNIIKELPMYKKDMKSENMSDFTVKLDGDSV